MVDFNLPEEERQKDLKTKLSVMADEQEERVTQYRAQQLGLSYISLMLFPIDPDVLEIVPKPLAARARAVLFYKQGKDLRLGVVHPDHEGVAEVIELVEKRFNKKPEVYVVSQRSLQNALARYRREREQEVVPQDEVRISQERATEAEAALESWEDLGQHIASMPPSEILEAIVSSAVQVRASDIHVEPQEKVARLRLRIDGVLQDVTEFGREGWALLLSRVKVLAKMKLNVREVPQDGSFILKVGEKTYDMRVSVLPGAHGENIVIRILDREVKMVTVEGLGMKKRDYDLVMQQLKKSNGMILVTGPTGSGKTTSLASFLGEVNRPELKIITLEDPIEYRLPGVEQTQVDARAGYTFAKGLRSILRQDPDIILVGEMRDTETAETAIHAALTGHLVFSTLHTNDAAGAIPRLVDLGVKPFVLAPSLNMIIAQRLVRKVCEQCRQTYVPDAAQREAVAEAMEGVSPKVFDLVVLRNPKLEFVKAVGCEACSKTGYKGRVGIFEIFAVEGVLEELVLKGADASQISREAVKQGMTTVAQDGYLKVVEQITTIEEVERVTSE